MIDHTMVSYISDSYIFYKDETREKVTIDKLDSIIDYINFLYKANRFAYKEALVIVESEREKLSKKHCPSKDEISMARNLGDKIDAELRREYYLRDAHEISGMSKLYSKYFEQCMFYDSLLRQIKAVRHYLEQNEL